MTVIKSFAVGNGDTFYIRHSSDNFTINDCDLNDENAERIIGDLAIHSELAELAASRRSLSACDVQAPSANVNRHTGVARMPLP
jgi:hypothetical protein